jgi:hypothetical protein
LDGVVRACFYAAEASDASLFPVNELRSWKLPFRVVAPPAMKGTPFEEYGRPDTWAVMRGEFYYVKNCSSNLFDVILAMAVLV